MITATSVERMGGHEMSLHLFGPCLNDAHLKDGTILSCRKGWPHFGRHKFEPTPKCKVTYKGERCIRYGPHEFIHEFDVGEMT